MNCKLVFLVIAAVALAQAFAHATDKPPKIGVEAKVKVDVDPKKVVKAVKDTVKSAAGAAAAAAGKIKVDPKKIEKALKAVSAGVAAAAAKAGADSVGQLKDAGTAIAAGVVNTLGNTVNAVNDITGAVTNLAVGAVGGVAGVVGGVGQGLAAGADVAGNALGNILFGSGINGGGGGDNQVKIDGERNPEPPKTGNLTSIDWNEIGFSYFNGRVFKSGKADMRSVLNTRNTIAALLKIETVGLASNARLNLCLRKPAGKGSVIVLEHSIPLCALPSLNRKTLSLSLGLKYIALPAQCPVPSGIFHLSYYYQIGGIDFFKGIPAGNYKVDFSITEGENVLLSFFWRVIITTKTVKPPKTGDEKPPKIGATEKPPKIGAPAEEKPPKIGAPAEEKPPKIGDISVNPDSTRAIKPPKAKKGNKQPKKDKKAKKGKKAKKDKKAKKAKKEKKPKKGGPAIDIGVKVGV